MLLVPYQVDVPMARRPIANYALIGVTCVVSLLAWRDIAQLESDIKKGIEISGAIWFERLVQDGFAPLGLVGCTLLHGDILHLIGNMIFLWVFGNAICAKIGQGWYLLTYAGLAVFASVTHALLDGNPSIGASGAINGIVGLYLVLYPINSIDCFWWFFYRGGAFTVRSFWMILLWLAFDIWGIVTGGGQVAYWAHIGGFAGGLGLGLILVQTGRVRMAAYEKSLIAVMKGKEPHPLLDEYGEEEPEDQPASRTEPTPVRKSVKEPPVTAAPPIKDDRLEVLCTCGKTLRVDRKHAGKKGRCPSCREEIVIPSV